MKKYIDAGVEVPTEINKDETDLFHVVIITEKKLNQATLEAEVKSKVQTFDDRSWLKHKDNLQRLGMSEVFIFHDPTQKSSDKKVAGGAAVKVDRVELIEKAKSLGYEGILTAKNSVFEEFIAEHSKKGSEEGSEEGSIEE